MKRTILAATALLLIVSAVASADPVKLRYKYSEGDTYVYSMSATGKGDMGMTFSGMGGDPDAEAYKEMPLQMELAMALETNVKDIRDDGLAVIESLISRYSVSQAGETVVDYNPAAGKKEGCPTELEELFMQPIEMKVDPQGGVSDISGLEKLRQIAPQFDMGRLVSQMQQPWPEKALDVGDKWTQELPFLSNPDAGKTDAPLNHLECVDYEEGKGLNCAKITTRFSGDLSGMMEGMLSGMPMQGAEMKVQMMFMTMDGEIYFAPEEGILVGMEFTMSQQMHMSAQVPPQQGGPGSVEMKMNMEMDGVYELE